MVFCDSTFKNYKHEFTTVISKYIRDEQVDDIVVEYLAKVGLYYFILSKNKTYRDFNENNQEDKSIYLNEFKNKVNTLLSAYVSEHSINSMFDEMVCINDDYFNSKWNMDLIPIYQNFENDLLKNRMVLVFENNIMLNENNWNFKIKSDYNLINMCNDLDVTETPLLDDKYNKMEVKIKSKQEKKMRGIMNKRRELQLNNNLDEMNENELLSFVLNEGSHSNKSKDVLFENFDVIVSGKVIVSDGRLSIPFGKKMALVGRNGVGKSTLLNWLSNIKLSKIPKHIKIIHIEQDLNFGKSNKSLFRFVLESNIARETLLKRESELIKKIELNDPHKSSYLSELDKIHAKLNEIEPGESEAIVSKLLKGLGFSDEDQSKEINTFSGGVKMKVSLARALFLKPDLLLLDEPTNMLDIKTKLWLQKYLVDDFSSSLLLVSHDVDFINDVCSEVVHLYDEKLFYYKGNYDKFLLSREMRKNMYMKEYKENIAYREKLMKFVNTFRYNASKANSAQSKLKILEKLPVMKPLKDEPKIKFTFPDIDTNLPEIIIEITDLSFKYHDSKTVLEGINLNIHNKSKIIIIGENNSGKSTFLRLITGEMTPHSGNVVRHPSVKLSYFAQFYEDNLIMDSNLLEYLTQLFPKLKVEEIRRHCGYFGLSGSIVFQKIYSLSGGQKTRLVFIIMSLNSPNVLLLDEPTNNLDIDSIDALTECLKQFEGAIILISHDTRFIESLFDNNIYTCENKCINKFNGSIWDYLDSIKTNN